VSEQISLIHALVKQPRPFVFRFTGMVGSMTKSRPLASGRGGCGGKQRHRLGQLYGRSHDVWAERNADCFAYGTSVCVDMAVGESD